MVTCAHSVLLYLVTVAHAAFLADQNHSLHAVPGLLDWKCVSVGLPKTFKFGSGLSREHILKQSKSSARKLAF